MNGLIIENVRCFKERQIVPIRPITLLVGENSTGKSTFLSLVRLGWKVAANIATPNFNEEPFLLGAYEQVAHFHGGRGKRSKDFSVGLQLGTHEGHEHEIAGGPVTIEGRFVKGAGQPRLNEWTCKLPQNILTWNPTADGERSVISVNDQNRTKLTSVEIPTAEGIPLGFFPHYFMMHEVKETAEDTQQNRERDKIEKEILRPLITTFSSMDELLGPPPRALAPIRSKVKRTYDPVSDVPDPEGNHVPMTLARIARDRPDSWQKLHQRLSEMGSMSGLFESVDIRRMGRKDSDPFQIEVSVGNLPFNIIDVGYGVSQALPLLADGILSRKGSHFLIQQPEVHLHPRAQAAFGTFLCSLAAREEKKFIVETHSDYLIDRIRFEVRENKALRHDDVVVLYFERKGNHVQIHPIYLDMQGNLRDVPPGYRAFFLEEQDKVLG